MTSLKDQNKLLTDAGKGVEAELKAMLGFKKNAALIPVNTKKKKEKYADAENRFKTRIREKARTKITNGDK